MAFKIEENIKKIPSLYRAFLFIEYREWDKADVLLEMVLNEDPSNAIAYLGKVMIAERVSDLESLTDISEATKASPDYQRMVRFADDNVKAVLNAIEEKKQEREKEEEIQKEETQKEADGLSLSTKEEELKRAVSLYRSLDGWSDSEGKAQKTEKRLQDLETVYVKMINRFNASATEEDYLEVVKYLQPVGEYKHAKQIAAEAEKRAKAYKEQQTIKRADMLLQRGDLASLKEAERICASIEGQEGKVSECRKRIDAYCTLQYSEALRLMAEGTEYSYTRAIQALNGIPDWRDSRDLIKRCEQSIEDLKEKEREEQERRERELAKKEETKESNESEEKNTPENTDEGVEGIEEDKKEEKRTVKGNKKSSKTKEVLIIGLLLIISGGLVYCFVTPLHNYLYGRLLFSTSKYEKAITQFEEAGLYRDSEEFRVESVYQYGLQLMDEQKYDEAKELFESINHHRFCHEEIAVCQQESDIQKAHNLFSTGEIENAVQAFRIIMKYDEAEAFRCIIGILPPYLETVENGEDFKFSNKKDLGEVLLLGIEKPEVRTIITEHSMACFSLISYFDQRYADVALYYERKSGDELSPNIEFDLELMSTWSGTWIGEANGYGDTRVFEVLEQGLLTPYTIMERSTISDITHLTGSGSKWVNGREEIRYYDMKWEGDEFIDSYRYSNEPWWVERLHRTSGSTPIDPLTMVDEVNSW